MIKFLNFCQLILSGIIAYNAFTLCTATVDLGGESLGCEYSYFEWFLIIPVSAGLIIKILNHFGDHNHQAEMGGIAFGLLFLICFDGLLIWMDWTSTVLSPDASKVASMAPGLESTATATGDYTLLLILIIALVVSSIVSGLFTKSA